MKEQNNVCISSEFQSVSSKLWGGGGGCLFVFVCVCVCVCLYVVP
jgi:hypothetical protein